MNFLTYLIIAWFEFLVKKSAEQVSAPRDVERVVASSS
jgi:hypothetical protein